MSERSSHIESYVFNGAIAVLVELSVSDPRAILAERFSELARDLAMHIAGMEPTSIPDLLGQPAVNNPDVLVAHVIDQAQEQISCEIRIVRFVRWVASSSEGDEPPRSPALIQRPPAA